MNKVKMAAKLVGFSLGSGVLYGLMAGVAYAVAYGAVAILENVSEKLEDRKEE